MLISTCTCQYVIIAFVVPTGCTKMKARRSQDRLDNFVLAVFHCAPCYTGLRPYLETRSDCVFMFGICCVIAVSFSIIQDYGRLEVTVCSCSVFAVLLQYLFLYYTATWDLSDCVFSKSLLCYCSIIQDGDYILAAWWIMQGKSVACTLLQLFNKVSIIVQVPTAPVSGTSSSWAVERTIVVCVLEKLMFIRFLLLKIKRKRIRSRLLQ